MYIEKPLKSNISVWISIITSFSLGSFIKVQIQKYQIHMYSTGFVNNDSFIF